jgi:hypothetical protein
MDQFLEDIILRLMVQRQLVRLVHSSLAAIVKDVCPVTRVAIVQARE